ncbi:hypothetical protein ABLE92_06600 [Gordonia sp. VNQ95]|uniref:hypothetical protein n=1 Tax=Gordonia sp. VNQ95 TaxID=3156619 RepID=UPI0032B4AD4F
MMRERSIRSAAMRLPGILTLLLAVIALVVAGCSNDESTEGSGGTTAIQPITVDVAKQADIASLLPAER